MLEHLVGIQYREEKAAQGGTGANQHTKDDDDKDDAQSGQSDHSAKSDDDCKTAEKIAGEHATSERTVRRAEKWADAVDKIVEHHADYVEDLKGEYYL